MRARTNVPFAFRCHNASHYIFIPITIIHHIAERRISQWARKCILRAKHRYGFSLLALLSFNAYTLHETRRVNKVPYTCIPSAEDIMCVCVSVHRTYYIYSQCVTMLFCNSSGCIMYDPLYFYLYLYLYNLGRM